VNKIKPLYAILLPKLADRVSGPSAERLHDMVDNSYRGTVIAFSQINSNRPPIDGICRDTPPIEGRARGNDGCVYAHSGAKSLSNSVGLSAATFGSTSNGAQATPRGITGPQRSWSHLRLT
jgi:hypothetical protein